MTLQISTVNNLRNSDQAWHNHSFELSRLQQKQSSDKESAQALAAELETQGYIKPPENDVYAVTEKGKELVRASAAGEVSRQMAEDALIGLLARVEQHNSDPTKLVIVEAVVVFGSFLGANEKLGDLDIAVKDRPRNLDDPNPSATAHA